MILKILSAVFLIYILLCLFAFLFGKRLAFPAPESSYTKESIPDLEFFYSKSGKKISTLYLKNPDAKYTIFYSHGNGEDIGEIITTLIRFYKNGYSVFAYDYFGYGLSEGKSDFENIYDCADEAWNYLLNTHKVNESEIAIFGYSMGSAPSTYLASKYNPRALILLGGFASAFETVLPVNILPWSPLNNAKFIRQVKCPILIAHGTSDFVVPFRNGKKLFKNSNAIKYFIKLENAGHYNAYEMYPQIVPKTFFNFINNLKLEDKFLNSN